MEDENIVERKYSKLRGRIIEKLGNLNKYAERMGLSYVSIHKKMKGIVEFKQSEIKKTCNILEIPDNEISEYFF